MQAEYLFEKGQMKLDQDLENQARYPYLEFQDTHLPPPPPPPSALSKGRAAMNSMFCNHLSELIPNPLI